MSLFSCRGEAVVAGHGFFLGLRRTDERDDAAAVQV